MNNIISISGLPWTATSRQLEDWLKGSFEVQSVKVLVDPLTSRSRGVAEVTFATVNDAERATVEIPTKHFLGKKLNVS